MKYIIVALLVGALGVWSGFTLEHHIRTEAWQEIAEMRFRQGWDEGYGYAREEVTAWRGQGETLISFSDGANTFLYKDWVYFETLDGKIYPISHTNRFVTKVNWEPYNVPLPERSAK